MLKHVSQQDQSRRLHQGNGTGVRARTDPETAMLRQRLIMEEAKEVTQERPVVNKVALTKELADLLYVVHGTAVAFGLPLEPAFVRVHQSNMSKLGDDGKPIYREDGKVKKGPNYQPPDLDRSIRITKGTSGSLFLLQVNHVIQRHSGGNCSPPNL